MQGNFFDLTHLREVRIADPVSVPQIAKHHSLERPHGVPSTEKGRSRRSVLPQSVLVRQTLYPSFSLSFISVQNIIALLDSPAVVHLKIHRWNNYLLIRPSDIENYPQHLTKQLPASCTTLLFVLQLHNVPSVSYHQLESFTGAERHGGKAEVLGSCREEGE